MIKKPLLLAVVLIGVGVSIWFVQSRFAKPTATGTKQEIILDGLKPETCEASGNCTSTQAAQTTNMPTPVETKTRQDSKKSQYPRAIELAGISGYLNTKEGFKLADVVGKKVVLVDFWTYSCINCQRTQPYLNAWYEKYKAQGLEIVGVHTPEFEFEKDKANVAAAIEKFNIKYPVVQDNDYQTWGAYANRYWPRKYLIDIDGYIVYDHIGEGGYDETEEKIQELLKERNMALGQNMDIPTGTTQPTNIIATDTTKAMSVETYFGASRNEFLGNGKTGTVGESNFVIPNTALAKPGTLYLGGKWNISSEFAASAEKGARVLFKYQAKHVYIVASSAKPATVTVLRDGVAVGSFAAADVVDGKVTISTSRLYKLIDEKDYGSHTIELVFDEPGVQVYTFTFG